MPPSTPRGHGCCSEPPGYQRSLHASPLCCLSRAPELVCYTAVRPTSICSCGGSTESQHHPDTPHSPALPVHVSTFCLLFTRGTQTALGFFLTSHHSQIPGPAMSAPETLGCLTPQFWISVSLPQRTFSDSQSKLSILVIRLQGTFPSLPEHSHLRLYLPHISLPTRAEAPCLSSREPICPCMSNTGQRDARHIVGT